MRRLLLVSLVLVAQDRPKSVVDFLDRTRGLPPEYHADLALRVVEAGRLDKFKAWKAEVIEEAFETATQAFEPFPLKGGWHTDQRSYVAAGPTGSVDRLTLRMRAVTAMMKLDSARATDMFLRSPLEPLPALDCKSPLTPRLNPYYETMALVFETDFTPEQRKRGEHTAMLDSAVGSVTSALQIEPIGEMALKLRSQSLLDALGEKLKQVERNPRTFAVVQDAPINVAYKARNLKLKLLPYINGLHAYLIDSVPAPQCARYFERWQRERVGARYNDLAKDFLQIAPEVPLIAPEKFAPEKNLGAWDDGDFWRSPRSKHILEDLRWLNHGNRDLPGDQRFWTLEERKSIAWRTRYDETQRRIEDWKEDEEPQAIDYIWMKSFTLFSLAEKVPPGPAQEAAFRVWLTFLESSFQIGGRQNTWFGLMQRGLKQKVPAMDHSRNPVIAAYAYFTSTTTNSTAASELLR